MNGLTLGDRFETRIESRWSCFHLNANQGNFNMNRALTLIAILVAAALSLPWTSQAKAQNAFSYVSHAGSDANDCASAATACRSLSTASGKTSEGGIVWCVDAGDFGA